MSDGIIHLHAVRKGDETVHYHYYPQEFIALQQELKLHPRILARIENCSDNAEAYGVIGAELGILLNGVYEPKELAAMLTTALRDRRTLIVV